MASVTTNYLVFKANEKHVPVGPPPGEGEDGMAESVVESWSLISAIEASGAQQAIRLVLADEPNPSGQFVAVPERSFSPIRVRTETRRTMKLEGVE